MTGEVNEVHSGSLSDHSLGISYHITNPSQPGASTRLLTPCRIAPFGKWALEAGLNLSKPKDI